MQWWTEGGDDLEGECGAEVVEGGHWGRDVSSFGKERLKRNGKLSGPEEIKRFNNSKVVSQQPCSH